MTQPNAGEVSVDVVPDTTGFEAALRAALARLGAVPVRVAPSDVPAFRAALQKALNRLPPVNVRVTPDLAGFRAAVQAAAAGLSIDIPVDVDTRVAAASLAAFRAAASRPINIPVDISTRTAGDSSALARSAFGRPIDIPVDLDTRAAMASYALLRSIVSRPIDIPVDLDTRAAAASLAALRAAMAGLNGSIGGSGGLGGAASRAGSRLQTLIRIGVSIAPLLVPAIAAATAAVVALGAAAAVAGAAIGTALLGFSGIGGALSALRSPSSGGGGGGDQAAQLARRRTDALLALQAAQRGVETAELDAAEAAIQSARRIESADRAVLRAQRELTAARVDAIRKLEDLALAQRRAVIDSEASEIALRRAQAELDAVNFDESKTADERRSAVLAVERAKLAIDEQALANGRLKEETDAATKAGVDGAQSVLDAQQALADAERERLDVAREVARQQRDTAISLLEAQLALEAAQRDYIDALNDTGAAAGGIDKVAEAMKKLSPAGREFVYFLHREVMPAIDRLKFIAQESMLPGVQGAIRSLFPIFGQLEKLVAVTGTALGKAAQTIADSFSSPAGLALLNYLIVEGPKIIGYITEIGTALGEIGSILIVAFGSTTDQIFRGIAEALRDFATWLAKAVNTPEFLEFLAYIRENGPLVMRLLGALGLLLIKIGIALAPLGSLLLKGLVAAFEFLASLDPETIVLIIGVIGFAIFALTGNVTGLIVGIVALAALMVAAWPAISNAVVGAWDWFYANALAPMGRFFTQTIPGWLSSLGNVWNNTWSTISSRTIGFANSIWTGVTGAFQNMYNGAALWVRNTLSYVSTSFNNLVAWIGQLPGRISAAVTGMFNAIPNAIRGALNQAIGYWNAFASRMSIGGFGLPSLSFFNTGGIVPGYTPGRDTTLIGVGGGEAVMRPEWTRAVGPGYVDAANAAARSGGTSGVERFLKAYAAPRGFATGGVVGYPSNLAIARPSPMRGDRGARQPVGQGQPLIGSIVLNGARSTTRSDAQLVANEVGWQVRTGVTR